MFHIALERAGLLQREEEGTQVAHARGGLPHMRKSLHVWHLVVTAFLLVYDIEALLGERLALHAVHIERCGGGCGLYGQLHLALGGEGVVERVEIIFALVAQTTCHGVSEEECRLWAVEEHGALGLGLTIHSEGRTILYSAIRLQLERQQGVDRN